MKRACDTPGCDGTALPDSCEPVEQPHRSLWLCSMHTKDLIDRYPHDSVRKALAARLRIPPGKLTVPRPKR